MTEKNSHIFASIKNNKFSKRLIKPIGCILYTVAVVFLFQYLLRRILPRGMIEAESCILLVYPIFLSLIFNIFYVLFIKKYYSQNNVRKAICIFILFWLLIGTLQSMVEIYNVKAQFMDVVGVFYLLFWNPYAVVNVALYLLLFSMSWKQKKLVANRKIHITCICGFLASFFIIPIIYLIVLYPIYNKYYFAQLHGLWVVLCFD